MAPIELTWKVRTLDDVRALVPSKQPKRVYYAARTCWWTVDAGDLYRMAEVLPPPPAGSQAAAALATIRKSQSSAPSLPCDPRGSVLMMTDDVEGFLQAAIAAAPSGVYGAYGLAAFMAAYHGNVSIEGKPTSLASWEEYNELLANAGEPFPETGPVILLGEPKAPPLATETIVWRDPEADPPPDETPPGTVLFGWLACGPGQKEFWSPLRRRARRWLLLEDRELPDHVVVVAWASPPAGPGGKGIYDRRPA